MPATKESIDLLGAVIANINNLLLIAIFAARIYNYPKVEYWLGLIFIVTIIPLTMMLVKASAYDRNWLYFLQLSLMIGFIVVEFLLDYLFKIDFRNNCAIVIPYVTLFYASLGGMIVVASQCGKTWSVITVITFLLMTASSLIMHFRTGS